MRVKGGRASVGPSTPFAIAVAYSLLFFGARPQKFQMSLAVSNRITVHEYSTVMVRRYLDCRIQVHAEPWLRHGANTSCSHHFALRTERGIGIVREAQEAPA